PGRKHTEKLETHLNPSDAFAGLRKETGAPKHQIAMAAAPIPLAKRAAVETPCGADYSAQTLGNQG
ncbi:MAG TPA: hypothetical protein VNB28_05775, partial [Methylomirabilota bacterium]|nr:hypothetical protein [Methylomirabilota bacterium]